MGQVTELKVRHDWALVRFAYLPLIGAGLWFSKLLFPVAVMSMRINACFVCALLYRWSEHIEEGLQSKPLLQLADFGLLYENGGEPDAYDWKDIYGVTLHRRNRIPPWKTGGSVVVTPPYWLTVTVRDLDPPDHEKPAERGYVVPFDEDPMLDDDEPAVAICVWPRQVRGGLFSLVRFAKMLQLELVRRARDGEIPDRGAGSGARLAGLGLGRAGDVATE